MNDQTDELQMQNITLKQKLKESKNKMTLLKFLSWIINDMKIKKVRKEIYDQQK